MSLIRYEPLNMLSRFQDDINQFFRTNDGMPSVFGENSTIATNHWLPSVDIKDEDKRYVIAADIPGVDPKDIEVSMDNDVLTIKGERKTEKKDEDNGYRRIECSYGSFYRRFSLPESVDSDKVIAKGKNGVLEITVPKREVSKAKPRMIEVKS